MSTTLQANRTFSLTTPLGDDVLLLDTMTVTEELGRPFECELELLSRDEQIKLEDLLGQTVTLTVELPEGEPRCFNGYVSRFSHVGRRGRYAHYRATLRPWLWFLTRTADCRIFQEKTVPEIIKEIFREHGFSDFDELLSADYRTWDYRVQYRETDFNFVSRLMEQEGIYYYFKHKEDKHTLVLSDSYSSHDLIPGYEKLPYYPPNDDAVREEHVFDWVLSQEIQPGAYALNEYDFEKPKAGLAVKSTISRQHAMADMEIYDYPGAYVEKSDGESYARVRIEELQAGYELVRGQSDARGLHAGGLFELTNFPREDQNREYLITSVQHRMTADPYESGTASGGDTYTCSFVAIDSKQPYRSPRSTPKPVVQGPQTATVVGKAGEAIWTDEYGRVKVQFHWDRNGKSDENSSCWVRVSQDWSGKKWGSVFVPHVGHEVLISFLEGDPDRPIITGRVYNADNMPPEDLPANNEKAVIRDVAGNHFIMTSTEGKEQIHMYSPYGNSKMWMGAPNRNEGLGFKTDLDMHMDVLKDWVTTISKDLHLKVAKDRTEKIDGNASREIGLNYDTIVAGKKMEKVIGPVELKYDGISVKFHGGVASETYVGLKHGSFAGGEVSLNASKKYEKNVLESKKIAKTVNYLGEEAVSLHAAKSSHVILKAGMAMISSGKSQVKIAKDGTITIKSNGDVNVEAKGNVNLQGKGQGVFMKGSNVSATNGKFKTKNLLDNG